MLYTSTITEKIKKLAADKQGRYRSFDHIHDAFINRPSTLTQKDKDKLALLLFYYLASWGMLRKSVLLQKDYTCMIPIIDILTDSKYLFLQNIDPYSPTFNDEKYIDTILELKERITSDITSQNYLRSDYTLQPMRVTDTLISKILLGTLACVLAYDKQVRTSLHNLNGFSSSERLNQPSLRRILALVRSEQSELLQAQEDIKTIFGKGYPIMKVLDLILWCR